MKRIDMFSGLLELDGLLGRAGHHGLTPYWREEFQRFYGHPTAAVWAARVGRGGIKSGTLVKFGINEVVNGDFAIPAGERHYFAFISARESEALERLRLIEAYLRALEIGYSRRDNVIELDGDPRGFRVFSANIGAVSGFRCFGYAADEVAKWRNELTGANPATEVLASVRAMTITHPNARGAIFSSPLGRLDHHYEVVERGTDADQYVSPSAPTWVANPSITEAETRRREPDPRIHAREYGAIPAATLAGAFDEQAIERAFEPRELGRASRRIGIVDPSSGRKDTWAACVLGWNEQKGRPPFVRVDWIDGIEGRFWQQVRGDEIVRRWATRFKASGVRQVHGDQRESLMLHAAFSAEEITYYVHDWTAQSKPRAIEQLRRWFADDQISLPEHARLRHELFSFEERITSSGAFTFGARGSGHDDYVALLITAAMIEIERGLPGSPLRNRNDPYGLITVRGERGDPGVLHVHGHGRRTGMNYEITDAAARHAEWLRRSG